MCPHDCFDILLYEFGIIIRQCKDCNRVEINTEDWVSIIEIQAAVERL